MSIYRLLTVLLCIGSAQAWLPFPPQGQQCQQSMDCPTGNCWHADCLQGACHYERLPIEECCLNSDECCEIAGEFEKSICDYNCTCTTIPTIPHQCTRDEHCDALISGLLCRAQGECHLPMCDAEHTCTCLNTTGLDLDQDGVACPDDCDDLDASVSLLLHCVRDKDNDQFAECDANAEPDRCRDFCVPPNTTCPEGWTDANDATRHSKPRAPPTNGTVAPCQPHPENACDCCDDDAYAYPYSPFVSNKRNRCGYFNYDCFSPDRHVRCCEDGHLDRPPHAYSSEEAQHGYYRTIWNSTCDCHDDVMPAQCGGCSTVQQQANLTLGWACELDCTSLIAETPAEGACPRACRNECVCVDASTPPQPGECAKFVDHCALVRPDVYGDQERCCLVAQG